VAPIGLCRRWGPENKRKTGVKIGGVSAELMERLQECSKKRVGVRMRRDREEVCVERGTARVWSNGEVKLDWYTWGVDGRC